MKLEILIIIILLSVPVLALRNPAAIYCEELGYEFITEKEEDGIRGYCLVENNKFDAWDFYQGKVGENYSYCASLGYNIESIEGNDSSYSTEYAICFNDNEKILQDELLNITEKIEEEMITNSNNNDDENDILGNNYDNIVVSNNEQPTINNEKNKTNNSTLTQNVTDDKIEKEENKDFKKSYFVEIFIILITTIIIIVFILWAYKGGKK